MELLSWTLPKLPLFRLKFGEHYLKSQILYSSIPEYTIAGRENNENSKCPGGTDPDILDPLRLLHPWKQQHQKTAIFGRHHQGVWLVEGGWDAHASPLQDC